MASPVEAGATLTDIQTELYSRGYDHLNQDAAGRARALRWINQSYQAALLEESWPFRLNTATGAAPLSVTDLGEILTVVDTANSNFELGEMTERELAAYDLTITGVPLWYFRDNLQIKTWPVGGTLSVRYYSLPPDLANGTDTTLIPKRYMDVIVDGAVRRAAKDRDNPDAVQLAESERQRGLDLMRKQLLVAPTHQQEIYGSHIDG